MQFTKIFLCFPDVDDTLNEFGCRDLKRTGRKPNIVVSLVPVQSDLDQLRTDYGKHGFIPELRFDLSGMNRKQIEQYLGRFEESGMKGIFTFRDEDPGKLEKFYSLAIPHENLVMDIELESFNGISIEVDRERLIVSSHFRSPAATMGKFSRISQMECGAIKIATYSDTAETVRIMWEIDSARDGRPVSFTPMGRDTMARIVSGLAVNDFMYSHYGRALGEGQPAFMDVERIISILEGYE